MADALEQGRSDGAALRTSDTPAARAVQALEDAVLRAYDALRAEGANPVESIAATGGTVAAAHAALILREVEDDG